MGVLETVQTKQTESEITSQVPVHENQTEPDSKLPAGCGAFTRRHLRSADDRNPDRRWKPGRTYSGVGDGGFAGGDGVGIQRDNPLAVSRFHCAAVPKAAFGKAAADGRGELLPDFVPAGAEYIAQKAHSV